MVTKDNLPLSTLTPLSKKVYEEVLTAHNISVLLLIRAYISEKGESVTIPYHHFAGFFTFLS